MKKFLYFAALLISSAMFVGCQSGQTPETSSTNLWPAYDANTKMWGWINRDGKFPSPAMYNAVRSYSCGYAIGKNGSSYYYVDTKGKQLNTPMIDGAADFYYGYARIRMNDKYGVMNTKGEFTIQPMYSSMGYCGNNHLIAYRLTSSDKVCGYLNAADGKIAISPKFESANPFVDGIAIVKAGDKRGAIDKSGTYVISPIYDQLSSLPEKLLVFGQGEGNDYKEGLIDQKGNVIVNAMYDYVLTDAYDGLITVCQNDKMGVIDFKGNVVIAPQYYDMSSFYEGYAAVQVSEDSRNLCIIDKKGNIIFQLAESERTETSLHNGLILTSLMDKSSSTTYFYKDIKGNVIYTWTETAKYTAPALAPAKDAKSNLHDLVERTIHFDSENL